MTPTVTDDPIVTGCPGDEITIIGTITLVPNVPGSYMYYPDVENTLTIEIVTPSGIVEAPISATVDNLQTNPYIDATWDFTATYTPTEVGTYTYTKTAVYWPGVYGDTGSAAGTFVVAPCEIDIKPGSCPNPINRKSRGSVPVAIIGGAGLDVTLVDTSTLELEGISIVPDNILYADVTQPDMPGPEEEDCEDCFDEDDYLNCVPDPDTGEFTAYCGDGFVDLVVKFDNQAIAALAEVAGAARGDCIELTLEGALLDGTPLDPMSDFVLIVK
jgi:hypothetical protein